MSVNEDPIADGFHEDPIADGFQHFVVPEPEDDGDGDELTVFVNEAYSMTLSDARESLQWSYWSEAVGDEVVLHRQRIQHPTVRHWATDKLRLRKASLETAATAFPMSYEWVLKSLCGAHKTFLAITFANVEDARTAAQIRLGSLLQARVTHEVRVSTSLYDSLLSPYFRRWRSCGRKYKTWGVLAFCHRSLSR